MKIGKYEVRRTIYEGALATVFEATEPEPPRGLGRTVALKLCTTDDADLRRRFAREAELTARVGHHPNITNAYDLGFHEQAPFLVEEYLSGADLRHTIERREELAVRNKITLLLQAAKGLQAAHAKGILHRDIKPENIRVLASGQVKIMDFGIGKVVAEEATRLTLEGTILGTLGYLAPEQLKGHADHRTDIFAYGVVAYELLTYEHPFAAQTLRDQFRVLMEADPSPLRDLSPESPPGLAALVHRCIDKEPDKRPQSFDVVVEDLRDVLRQLDQDVARGEGEAPGASAIRRREQSSPPPRPRTLPPRKVRQAVAADGAGGRLRRTALVAGIGLLAGLGVLVLAFLVWPSRQERPLEPGVSAPQAVFIDAFPWGELTRVIDSDGIDLQDVPRCVTPCVIALPPGSYQLDLVNPGFPGRQASCRAEVTAGGTTCRAEFVTMTSDEYFRQAGWWR